MAETLKSFASLLRSFVTLVLLAIIGVGGWIGYDTLNARSRLEAELAKERAEIEKLNAQVAAQAKQIEELDLSLRLVKRDHRLAEIRVLDQWDSPKEPKRPMTKIEFVEVNDQLEPIDQPRVFTIEGDLVYVDAWVVKYLDKLIEKGDPIRGTSICIFKRLFGEYQEPSEGFVLDAVGSRPAAYNRAGAMPELEREIWRQFWDFANDPDKAERAGIRAAHPEAPSIKLRPGKTYVIELRASGGLSITPKGAPRPDGKEL